MFLSQDVFPKNRKGTLNSKICSYSYLLNYQRNTTRKHKQQQQRICQDTWNQHMCFSLISNIGSQSVWTGRAANTLNNLCLNLKIQHWSIHISTFKCNGKRNAVTCEDMNMFSFRVYSCFDLMVMPRALRASRHIKRLCRKIEKQQLATWKRKYNQT